MLRRLSRLFQADFHAVLDQLEDPESLLKQSLREMEEEIDKLDTQLRNCRRDKKLLEQQIEKCEIHIEEIESQLDLCFNSNNEALARDQLRKRLEWQRQLKQLQQNREQIQQNGDDLDQQLQNFRQRHRELKQKAELFLVDDEPEISFAISRPQPGTNFEVTEQELELAWLKEVKTRNTDNSARNQGGGKNKELQS